MTGKNPMRMDYYKKYQEIIAGYNREKDRVTVEETLRQFPSLQIWLDRGDSLPNPGKSWRWAK